MEPYYLILVLVGFLRTSFSHSSNLQLTIIDLKYVNDATSKTILKLVEDLNNPKIEASKSERTNSINIVTEEDVLQKMVITNITRHLGVPEQGVSVRRLPDVKIKDNYRLHKRAVEMFDIDAFNTHESINDYLEELTVLHPDVATTKIIGYSFQNRPIKILKLNANNGAIKPKIFMDGGQHAREWISPAVLLHIVHQLIEGYRDSEKSIKHLLDQYEFHVLPILNPDGYVYSYADTGIRLWRKNRKNTTSSECTGVDLNRNWDFHWAGRGGSGEECSIVYQGEYAFSETETEAASNHILNHKGEWHSYFSFHSFGQMILFPYSHTRMPTPDYDRHVKAGRSLADGIQSVNNRTYIVGAVGIILYEAAGSSESWAYSVGVPYAFTIELPDLYTFIVPTDVIEPTAKEWLHGFMQYFKHTEANEPDLYDEIVGNISATLTEEERMESLSAKDISSNGAELVHFAYLILLPCSVFLWLH